MNLRGRLFITGGAGYLGRAILRRIHAENWPCKVTVYSRDEAKHWALRSLYPDVHFILGDVRDRERLAMALVGHDILIHAAAQKFVDIGEREVEEFVSANIDGTRAAIAAARQAGVERAVFISTDKACLPVNAYGASKMLGERLWAEANDYGDTAFVAVRYGNVVGSTGSVVPLFQAQARNGAVQLTDDQMTRFWLSADEAVDLIAAACSLYGASLVVPKARSMRMLDLAQLIADEHDADVRIVGRRPGEKVHETLIHEQESVRAVEEPDRFVVLRATESVVGNRSFSYTSDQPASWIELDEMGEMIAASAEI